MAAQALICPSCGARNRTSWEFCARCGETLPNVTVRISAAEPPVPEETEVSSAEASFPPGWLVLTVGVVLLGANTVACLRFTADAPPPPPADAGVFAAMGNQPSPPPSAPSVVGPGNKEFQEGYRLLSRKRAADAIPLLIQAAAAAPDKPEYQQALAEAYWATGAKDQALGLYQRAAALDPGRYGVDYATALDGAGRTDDAVRAYQSLLTQDAGNAQVQESLARLYARTGNYAAAAPLLEKAAALAPNDPVLLQELAYALEKTSDPAKALDVYRRVVALAPNSPINRSRLAENLLSQGKNDEALGVLKEGITLTPQAPLLQRQMGSVLERSGNYADAAKAYRDYAQLAPNATDAKDLAARADTLDAIVAQRKQQ